MGLFDDEEYGRVVDGSGDYARVESLQGHLLVVFPLGYIAHHPTRFTVPGKKSDVIVCDVIDLDDYDDNGQPGKIYRTAWWRQAQLIMNLRPVIGKRILGRIAKGISRNGMNPPWIINDAVAEPGATDRARAWGQAHPDFILSVFEQPPVMPAERLSSFDQYQQQGPPQGPPQGYGQHLPPQPLPPPPLPPQPQQVQPQQYQQYGAPQQGYAQPPANYQYQQPPQAPPQPPAPQFQQYGVPGFPVNGAPQVGPGPQMGPGPQPGPAPMPPPQDQSMLQLMRAQKERREAEEAQWADQPPY